MSPDVAVMGAGLPRGVRLEQMSAAVRVLTDPAGPGEPWTAAEVAAVLPLLAEGPSGIATEAWGMRLLAAADQAATRTPTPRP
ncbi:hypothetical protein RM844_30435 [Streptomyces sp. DSM 44915]|uniref:Uncharacterized protein n=1 Tax=Streptomyces chisholmiae TaxID=3075540 RepID=A0ABU2K043_9ACTN|nr:hypothetical protein [Streptomyces sp. DSM 44915]MDT0270599.1 hypothetical protein [Streptomyces sp. DSM 44915]